MKSSMLQILSGLGASKLLGRATVPVRRKISSTVTPSGRERFLGEDEIIVSKTDLTGHITYANEVFARYAGYSEAQLIGAPHSIVRHPAMPRCVFKLLWDTLAAGREIFAYVINLAANGDHYWVFAHVTPSLDENGAIVGYHSMRRAPRREVVTGTIEPIYAGLLAEEARHRDRKAGMDASTRMFEAMLAEKGQTYDQLVLSL